MVILKTNRVFMEENRFKFPAAIKKLGLAFGQAVVLEDEEPQGGGPPPSSSVKKKRAGAEKVKQDLNQTRLVFTKQGESASRAEAQTGNKKARVEPANSKS
jgi:hypothetical protein